MILVAVIGAALVVALVVGVAAQKVSLARARRKSREHVARLEGGGSHLRL